MGTSVEFSLFIDTVTVAAQWPFDGHGLRDDDVEADADDVSPDK